MIRGMKKAIVKNVDNVNFNINAKIHNRFDIEVLDAETGELKQSARAYNTICNNLWTRIANKSSYFSYIHYGRGLGTPSTSDKSLFSFIGYGSVSPTETIDWANGIYSRKGKLQLNAATAVGETITEVGIAYDSTTSSLCTHAMLQDMNGNPISILKTETDVINIYATVFVHFSPEGYDDGSIRLYHQSDSSLLSCLAGRWSGFPNKARASNALGIYEVNGYYMPAFLKENGNADYPAAVDLTVTFDTAKKTITFKVGRFEASGFNYGGIEVIYLAYDNVSGTLYKHLPSIILKPGGKWFQESSVINEAVGTGDGVTKDFALDFQHARDIIAYIDGVATDAASVDYAPVPYVTAKNYIRCFQPLKPQSTVNNHIPDFGSYVPNGGARYLYNPEAERLGISLLSASPYFTIKASQDFVSWFEVIPYATSYRTDVAVPTEYQHYKYWLVENKGNPRNEFISAAPAFTCPTKVLHFENPPPAGSVITADYKCDCIAKDVNHVFDVTVTVQLGEYTEAL